MSSQNSLKGVKVGDILISSITSNRTLIVIGVIKSELGELLVVSSVSESKVVALKTYLYSTEVLESYSYSYRIKQPLTGTLKSAKELLEKAGFKVVE
jgi:ABC-type transport system substrate-binding protein